MHRTTVSKATLKINQTAGGFIWDYEGGTYTEDLDISQGNPIYGNKNYYVFKNGTIYNTIRKSIIKPIKNASGYCYISLSNNKIKKNYYIHRIVAEHFIENNLNKEQVNHKNKKRDDNRIENLEWVSKSENMKHAMSKVLNI